MLWILGDEWSTFYCELLKLGYSTSGECYTLPLNCLTEKNPSKIYLLDIVVSSCYNCAF